MSFPLDRENPHLKSSMRKCGLMFVENGNSVLLHPSIRGRKTSLNFLRGEKTLRNRRLDPFPPGIKTEKRSDIPSHSHSVTLKGTQKDKIKDTKAWVQGETFWVLKPLFDWKRKLDICRLRRGIRLSGTNRPRDPQIGFGRKHYHLPCQSEIRL